MTPERAIRCYQAIQRGDPVSVPWLMEKFGISKPQAARDLLELERILPLVREPRVGPNGYARSVLVPMASAA